MRGRDQHCCPVAEWLESGLRFAHQSLQARAGGCDAEQADEGRFMRSRVFTGRLSDRSGVAIDIEQIVGDLKGFADSGAVALERDAEFPARVSKHGAAGTCELQQCSGLHRLQTSDAFDACLLYTSPS